VSIRSSFLAISGWVADAKFKTKRVGGSHIASEQDVYDAYNELCCYTLAHGDASFIHQHVVDAFAARRHMQLTRQKRPWPAFALPVNRGSMTAVEVLAACAEPERDSAIHAWCAWVWEVFIRLSAGALPRTLLSSVWPRAEWTFLLLHDPACGNDARLPRCRQAARPPSLDSQGPTRMSSAPRMARASDPLAQ
jgi:hypothetical protein